MGFEIIDGMEAEIKATAHLPPIYCRYCMTRLISADWVELHERHCLKRPKPQAPYNLEPKEAHGNT